MSPDSWYKGDIPFFPKGSLVSLQNPSHVTPGRRLRVLIVDDEHAVADSLALILKMSGYNSLAVYAGLDAVAAIPAFHPDVVLSDVMMPDMDGFELAEHLAETYPDCKVLLMSGNDAAITLAEQSLATSKFLNVLTKPVRPQTILDFLAACAEAPAVG